MTKPDERHRMAIDATVQIDRIVAAHARQEHAPRRAALPPSEMLSHKGPHPRRRACGELFYCARFQTAHALHVLFANKRSHPHPLKGLPVGTKHNAKIIMRSALNAHSPLTPHNLR